jgi:amino acid transporter
MAETEPSRRQEAPGVELRELRRGSKPGSRYLRMVVTHDQPLRYSAPGRLTASEAADRPEHGLSARWYDVKRVVLGARLASARLAEERLTKIKALAVFGSDPLSSSAYATEEILLILVLAGTGALFWSIPISLGITLMMIFVTVSYVQIVRAYPNGGGAYHVAHENLGRHPGLIAASALTIDYVLTVAVSTAAGVAALSSALPELQDYRLTVAVGMVALVTLINLRGVTESGTIFAIPTYGYVFTAFALIAAGLVQLARGEASGSILHTGSPEEELVATQGITLFLIMRAFSGGSTALTGIEAIANGVPTFKRPEVRNAQLTLIALAAVLATVFVGLTFLVNRYGVVPSEDETVISQLARAVFGGGFPYYLVQIMTALILLLAANTAFNGFPRLASVLAKDRYLPHHFSFRGDRLAFTNGIIVLGLLAVVLLFVFNADVHDLIPLYAVGVFLSFTLSQAGMVKHWLAERDPGWKQRLTINGFGGFLTGIVAIVIIVTKFLAGAWITLLLIPLFWWMFHAINRHYTRVSEELEVPAVGPVRRPRIAGDHAAIIPVAEINKAVLRTNAYAKQHSRNVTAIHITDDLEEAERFREQWDAVELDIPLVIIESPYRSFTAPLLSYIDQIDHANPGKPVTVILPEFVPRHWWQTPLHNQTALRLKAALLFRPNTVVIDVPYHLGAPEDESVRDGGEAGNGGVKRGDVDLE